ncbi:hypothetical protein [Candidatus Merdisoma sp. JLR.KK006]|uniref:hypothetical protein n=1 Tax=Candidatus Merdisoma sp. JLR.KK006 TaxID=3112626 RepID=UPI002FF34EC2
MINRIKSILDDSMKLANIFCGGTDLSYLGLAKKIEVEDVSVEELENYLSIPNITVIKQTILKIIEKNIKNSKVYSKLLEYTEFMDDSFKILGPCKLGHFAIYALKQLGYNDDFQIIFNNLKDDDKKTVMLLENSLFDR